MTSLPASPSRWKVPSTQELASMPAEQIAPLAFGVSRPWLRAWQDANAAPATISLRKLAERWHMSYDILRKMHNGYFTPDRRAQLADLKLLAAALAPVGVPYEVILLASLGYLAEHPSMEAMLRLQPDRVFIEKALTWLHSDAWQASGIYRQQVVALLEEEQFNHLSPPGIVRTVAFLIGCWRALSVQGDAPESLEDLAKFL